MYVCLCLHRGRYERYMDEKLKTTERRRFYKKWIHEVTAVQQNGCFLRTVSHTDDRLGQQLHDESPPHHRAGPDLARPPPRSLDRKVACEMYERVAPDQRRLLTWPTADICASVLGRFDPDPDAGFFTGKKGEEVWHQTVQQWDHLQAILDKCFRHAALHQINRLGRTALMEARLSRRARAPRRGGATSSGGATGGDRAPPFFHRGRRCLRPEACYESHRHAGATLLTVAPGVLRSPPTTVLPTAAPPLLPTVASRRPATRTSRRRTRRRSARSSTATRAT